MSLRGASAASGAAASGPGTGGLPIASLTGESAGDSPLTGPPTDVPGLSPLGLDEEPVGGVEEEDEEGDGDVDDFGEAPGD